MHTHTHKIHNTLWTTINLHTLTLTHSLTLSHTHTPVLLISSRQLVGTSNLQTVELNENKQFCHKFFFRASYHHTTKTENLSFPLFLSQHFLDPFVETTHVTTALALNSKYSYLNYETPPPMRVHMWPTSTRMPDGQLDFNGELLPDQNSWFSFQRKHTQLNGNKTSLSSQAMYSKIQ